jgi:predicted SAM-dependent methyltransferase
MKIFFKDSLKHRISYGLRKAAWQLRHEWILFRLHRREVKKVPRFLQVLPVKLHLGCGPNRKNGWVNVDLFDPRADLQLDLREPWPFPDNSVSYIYSEHVFEHFEVHVEVPHLLREALRVLEPGGVFDVAVPDTEPPLKAYGDPSAPYWSTALAMRWHPRCQTQLERINYHFRQDGEHKYAWDAETLARTLVSSGFVAVFQRDFDPTMDSPERVLSLYMVGKKPVQTVGEKTQQQTAEYRDESHSHPVHI